MFTDYFPDEKSFTDWMAKTPKVLKKLYEALGIPYSESQYIYPELASYGGRADIYDRDQSTVIEAMRGKLDLDHINRASTYALSIEEEYNSEVENVILLCEGAEHFEKLKVTELNLGNRNYYVVQYHFYKSSSKEVECFFSVLEKPTNVRQRNFIPKETRLTVTKLSSQTRINNEKPWRNNLQPLIGMRFYGSLGEGNLREEYWLEYTGIDQMFVSSIGEYGETPNKCMIKTRKALFLKSRGTEGAPNLNVWNYHKNENGKTIDEVLKESFYN